MAGENALTPYELFGPITHIGIVVKDMDSYVKKLEEMFGYTVDEYSVTPDSPDKRYYGEYEDFAVKMAFIHTWGREIEILMPLRGRSVWRDSVEKNGDGLHHFNYNVSDFDAAISHLESFGCKMVQCGMRSREEGCRWAYVDATEQIGYFIEIAESHLPRE